MHDYILEKWDDNHNQTESVKRISSFGNSYTIIFDFCSETLTDMDLGRLHLPEVKTIHAFNYFLAVVIDHEIMNTVLTN